jgi:hypothetical protein
MKTETVKTNGGLPATLTNMAAALAQSAGAVGGSGGGDDLFMRFTKFGSWEYGPSNTEVEEGSIWAVNPEGFKHGFIAWDQDNTSQGPTGELLVPATQPMPNEADLPAVSGSWSQCIAVQMRCTNGEDKGVQILWKANSKGARKAYATLLQAVIARVGEGHADVVPLVSLEADSYNHKTYGKIFAPMVEVVGWADMEGNTAEEPEPPEEPEEAPAEEKPARRRRRKAS